MGSFHRRCAGALGGLRDTNASASLGMRVLASAGQAQIQIHDISVRSSPACSLAAVIHLVWACRRMRALPHAAGTRAHLQ